MKEDIGKRHVCGRQPVYRFKAWDRKRNVGSTRCTALHIMCDWLIPCKIMKAHDGNFEFISSFLKMTENVQRNTDACWLNSYRLALYIQRSAFFCLRHNIFIFEQITKLKWKQFQRILATCSTDIRCACRLQLVYVASKKEPHSQSSSALIEHRKNEKEE